MTIKRRYQSPGRPPQSSCTRCGQPIRSRNGYFCSNACYRNPRSQWGPLRVAWVDRDADSLMAELLTRATPGASGCLIWTGQVDRNGYPRLFFRPDGQTGKKSVGVHRIVAEVFHGPLHDQAVHHTCSNRKCVAPDHVIPVTQAENTAEMLARRALEARILELELALSAVAPDHPALAGTGRLSV